MLFKLAWRNIWRNKRRTLITAASILFAVLLASLMEALQKGAWKNMIGNVVNFYFGYAQVHTQGYWGDQTIDKAFVWSDSLKNLGDVSPAIIDVLPRLESFALASTGNSTTGALVVGIDPLVETRMTRLQERLVAGAYLKGGEEAVLVAEGLAENLNLQPGDTLVLISQGYRGVNAAGKYPVKGLVRFGSPELNRQMVYLPLETAQWFFGAEGMLTSLALHIEDPDRIRPAVAAVKARLDPQAYEVLDWQELLPDLVQAQKMDSVGNYVVYFILYFVIAFGIFGTILMMTKERQYEFGVLTAIGMRRGKLALTVWIEIVLLGLVGALAGIILAVPTVWYFNQNPIRFSGNYAGTLEKFGFEPIFPADFNASIFLLQALIVLIITAVLALFPWTRIRRLKPVEAMRA